ncbi:Protein F14H12.3, partial [Lasius niger]
PSLGGVVADLPGCVSIGVRARDPGWRRFKCPNSVYGVPTQTHTRNSANAQDGASTDHG